MFTIANSYTNAKQKDSLRHVENENAGFKWQDKSTSFHNKPLGLAALLLAVLMITSLACSISGLSIGKDSATVDVTLKQDDINNLIAKNNVSSDSDTYRLLEKVTRVEIHDGFIRVFGTNTASDGSEISGSYDFSMSAENDILKVKVIAVDIAGIDITDSRIIKLNQELEKELTKVVTESKGDVLFKEATVKDGTLKLKVQVNFEKK